MIVRIGLIILMMVWGPPIALQVAVKPPEPIKVTGESAQRIKDAYTNVQFANQQLEYVVLDAKYNLNVPKDYLFDPATFSFIPPKKTEAKP